MSSSKLALPIFLKVLTNGNMPMAKAMAVAKKLYKTHNTPEDLGTLTDAQLKSLGIEEKEDRKLLLAAIRKAGYKKGSSSAKRPGPGSSDDAKTDVHPRPKKRKRDSDLEEPQREQPYDEGAELGSFEFNEVLDEAVLKTKATVVNRAPVMTAWATVVAERLGFKREEALSVASAYTEMNAISKGVSLGVFEQSKGKGVELKSGESQPYVDFMGRRAVYTTQLSQWRALLKGEPVHPAAAFSYMQRSFKQTLPHVMGAMRLLAESYPPAELNRKGFGLYADFRPQVDGWGKRSEMRCENVLELRKVKGKTAVKESSVDAKTGSIDGLISVGKIEAGELKGANVTTISHADEDGVVWDDSIDFDDPSLQGI